MDWFDSNNLIINWKTRKKIKNLSVPGETFFVNVNLIVTGFRLLNWNELGREHEASKLWPADGVQSTTILYS